MPPPVAIKICGLTTPEAVAAARESGATHLGFVFIAGSPRAIAPEAAARLAEGARGMQIVALLDAHDPELAAAVRADLRPSMVQLYGAADAAAFRTSGVQVIRPVLVAGAADLAGLEDVAARADWLLFDAKPAASGALPGGHGVRFEARLLAGRAIPRPWFLAGGLSPETVAEAIRLSGARAVDVSSGVERARGLKDPERIRRFVANARAAFSEVAA